MIFMATFESYVTLKAEKVSTNNEKFLTLDALSSLGINVCTY